MWSDNTNMKFPFHHRAFYCYLAMTVWIFFLITAMYKYISEDENAAVAKKVPQPLEHVLSKTDVRFRKNYMKSCNPPDSIVRVSEAAVDLDSWVLQGVLVLTRHGDRGPLTHLRNGDKIPCDTPPPSPLLKNYEEYVVNVSGGVPRGPWASAPGAFHNFPSLPPRPRAAAAGPAAPAAPAAVTHCPLGQLTSLGLLQMLTVGAILKDAYADKLGLDVDNPLNKKDTGEVVTWSTRYRRTYQSLLGALWPLAGAGMARAAAAARESHAVPYCFRHCACSANSALTRKINKLGKQRLESHPAIKDLINKISKVIFESQENADPEIVKDALLAYMCHDAPLPCSEKPKENSTKMNKKKLSLLKRNRKYHSIASRNLMNVDDYSNIDFNNDFGKKARDIIGKYDDNKQKSPLDFDAQMEREKLLYYQQRYLDNSDGYEDVVIVKKNLDTDFNFPNDARVDEDFEEDYKESTPEATEDFCVKKEHVNSLFAYLEWSYKQETKNVNTKRRGLLLAYGLIHNVVQNMIRIISENKPKMVIYSGHDKTLHPLLIALGLNEYQSIRYASRVIFEVYRRKDLRDEFKFTKRKAIAQDFYFRVVYNGEDITNRLSFCKRKQNIVMKVVDPIDDMKMYNTYLCPIESIVRFIHDDYFSIFNVSNYKDACAIFKNGKISL